MSYLRGHYYLWRDDDRTHFWAQDGSDSWDETAWGDAVAHDQGHFGAKDLVELGSAIVAALAPLRNT